MAGEVVVSSSLTILRNKLDYISRPLTFAADMVGRGGPVPGMIVAVTTGQGTTPSFTGLTTPTFMRIQNLDEKNFVELGVDEAGGGTFSELLEIGPGESYVVKLSRNITIADVRVKANAASCDVLLEAFEK